MNKITQAIRIILLTPMLAHASVASVDPISLITPLRFSIMAKYITVQYWDRGYQTNWADLLYKKHLKIWNNFKEEIPQKKSLQDYVQAFKKIINSIKQIGFDPSISVIEIGSNWVCDGEHRIATALYFQKNVAVKLIDYVLPADNIGYSSEFFKQKGLDKKYLDHMALEYAKLKKNCYVVILFPIMGEKREEAYKYLREAGKIVYSKTVPISKNGSGNLIKHLYELENYNNFWSADLHGARAEAKLRFNIHKWNRIEVILWECESLEKNKACKEAIRDFYKNRYVIHINDTHKQTVYHAQVLFNRNSVHFLNKAQPKKFERFFNLLKLYENLLMNKNYNQEFFCIDSSAVLSAYGIRDCADLDFLHFGYPELLANTGNKLISSHNHPDDLKHHVYQRDDIIFNPDHYFYYKGFKFASLETVKKMKEKRNEPKDRRDIELIKNVT